MLSCFSATTGTFAQIGAEAQGGKLTSWVALGIDQQISERWISVTDFGYGRHSDPDNTRFVKRSGLDVITQDFIYRLDRHWSLALGAGYWRRQYYMDDAPFDHRTRPYEYRNEFRPYQRIYFKQHWGGIKLSHSLRTDIRFYYTEDMHARWSTPFEFRLRYMESWNIPLSKDRQNQLVLVDELLSAADKYGPAAEAASGKKWSPWQLTENRFSVYYRRSFHNADLDLGIMHQYWREKPGIPAFNTSYNMMLDLIIHDPFTRNRDKNAAEE